MLHKAWNSKGEMPYCFPRSSIKFQGHTVQNITDFDPNWAFPDYRPVAGFKSLRFALVFFAFFLKKFSKVRVGAKEGGSHYWEMAVAITCGYGGYLLPLLAAHSSLSSFHTAAQGSPFLKIITCPTPRIFKFFYLLIWNKEEKSVRIHLPDW